MEKHIPKTNHGNRDVFRQRRVTTTTANPENVEDFSNVETTNLRNLQRFRTFLHFSSFFCIFIIFIIFHHILRVLIIFLQFVDVWAHLEWCLTVLSTGVLWVLTGTHPSVWHLPPSMAVEVPERQLLLAWLPVEWLLTVVNASVCWPLSVVSYCLFSSTPPRPNPLHCGDGRLVGQYLHKSDRSQPLSISSIHGLTLFLLLLLESFASLDFIPCCTVH